MLPCYDRNLLINAEYENGDVGSMTVRPMKVVEPREMYVDFMETWEPRVDHDLVYSVLEMLAPHSEQILE